MVSACTSIDVGWPGGEPSVANDGGGGAGGHDGGSSPAVNEGGRDAHRGGGGAASEGGSSSRGGAGGSEPECITAEDCSDAATECSIPTCERGLCGKEPAAVGTSCDGDSMVCDGTGQCVTPLALGASCSDELLCESGFCVDGVCCNGECGLTCVACNGIDTIDAMAGKCSPVIGGFDPADECAGELACNGVAGCD